MLDFVKAAFRGFFEVILWINLIVWTILGGIFGNYIGGLNPYADRHPIIGAIIGLIAGLLLNIIGGGFIATFLNINENLEELKNNLLRRSDSSPLNLSNISPVGRIQEQKKCKKCGKKVDSEYTSCPHCGAADFE
jgi:hypothetical protein